MKKQICLIGFVVAFSICGFAQAEKTKKTVEINQQLYYMHEVSKGQTVYRLCKLYDVTEKEIYKYNPQVEKGLKVGDTVYILISPLKKEEKKEKTEEKKIENGTPTTPQTAIKHIVHTVEQGETLYGIARKYGVTVEAIKEANPALTDILNIGQEIIIPIEKTKQEGTKPTESDATPSSEPENAFASKKNEYTVFVLIPLYLSAVDTIEPTRIKSLADYGKIKSFAFIQFYEALLLATENITHEYPNIKINLNIEDVSSPSQMTALINSERLEDADLIIGPFFAKEFSLLCQYAQKKKIMLVNPFSANFETCGTKVYKATASLHFQGEQFAKYVVSNYENAKIIFANYQTNEENEKIKAYKTAMQSIFSKSEKSFNIQEINVVNNGIAGVQSAMTGNAENFVFTFFNGELRVTNFVQNLNKAKTTNLTLVAPQFWLDYDNIETEYFMNLKTHYIAQHFVDYSNPNVIRFIDAFRSGYDTEPTLELFAFQGYDFTYYFLSNLCENGTYFQSYTDKNSKLLSTKFEFIPTSNNLLENSFVHIFKLKNYEYMDATLEENE